MLTVFPRYVLMYKVDGAPQSVLADTLDDLAYEYKKVRHKNAMYQDMSIQIVDTQKGMLPPTDVIPLLIAGTPTTEMQDWFYANFSLEFVQSFRQEGRLDLEDGTVTYQPNDISTPHNQAKYFFLNNRLMDDCYVRITPHNGDRIKAVEQLMILLYHQPTDGDSVYERLCEYKGFLKFDFDD